MIGHEHARILAALPEANLLACCDIDPDRHDSVPVGVSFLTDLQQTLGLAGLEAVWVCTPQHLHRPIVEQALALDLAVFCEKPIAHSLEDADAMIATAESSRGVLVIGHTLRFDPDYLAAREAVARGDIGNIVQMAARWNAPDYEGRIISGRTTVPLEMMIHDIDIFRWLAGPVERVYAEASPIPIVGPGPDAAVGTLRFRSGAVGILDHNWIMASETGIASDHRLAVFGTAGSVYVEFRDPPTWVFSPKGVRREQTTYSAHPRGIPSGALATEDRYFLRSIRNGSEWPITLSDARAALACAVALNESSATSRPVLVSEIAAS